MEKYVELYKLTALMVFIRIALGKKINDARHLLNYKLNDAGGPNCEFEYFNI